MGIVPQFFTVGQRKFILTAWVLMVASAALFTRYMTADQFMWCAGTCLAMYKVANITDKRLGGAG